MNATRPIPEDLQAIAQARGLKVTHKAGAFTVSDRREVRLTTRSASELRQWLQSIAAVIATKETSHEQH